LFKTLKKILLLLPSGDKIKLFVLFLMMLFAALLEVVGIGMIPVFVSIIASPEKVFGIEQLQPVLNSLSIESDGDLLVYGATLLIIVFIFKNAYLLIYKYIQTKFIWGRFAYLSNKLFEHYMAAPYEFHLSKNTSEINRNITQEARYLVSNVLTPLLKLAMDAVLIFGIFGMLLWIEPLITIITFALLGGAGGLFLKFIREKTGKYGKTGQTDRAMMIKVINEGFGGIKDVRVLNRERWFNDSFDKHVKSYTKSMIYMTFAGLANKPLIETIAVIGMLLIALLLYWQGSGMEVIIPMLALFGAATIRLMPAVREAVSAVTNLRYYIHTVDPIFNDITDLKPDYQKKNKQKSDSNSSENRQIKNDANKLFSDSIQFHNVTYRYPGSEINAVNKLSLEILKGQVVGFVGASGAGKTTLVDLLLGLLVPVEGKILVDGEDIHSNINRWKQNIGYIPQFIFMADNTIRRNIAYGLPDEEIDDEMLWNAIGAAQLTELIRDLPNGVETVIGEHGTRLSGGQRQRIGIARALYHNPEVLIMDEATSALDNFIEDSVIDAIEKIKDDKTIIMIAHRFTTLKNCDKICFIENGIIKKIGTYDSLLEHSI
jgi:ATP-binding cassette, subfamily B, bacterial PglK